MTTIPKALITVLGFLFLPGCGRLESWHEDKNKNDNGGGDEVADDSVDPEAVTAEPEAAKPHAGRAEPRKPAGPEIDPDQSGEAEVTPAPSAETPFDPSEKSIDELQVAMAAGQISAVQLVEFHLDRIEALDRSGPELRALISVISRQQALIEAKSLDDERAKQGPRGRLHGIPVVLKDSIDAQNFATTGGASVFEASMPLQDATVTRKLRAAGAIVIAKANLDELQISARGKSTLGGQTLNPYDLHRISGGSSAGSAVAVAANLAPIAVGADTNGSIRTPSAYNGIFGLRPTRGLVSRAGSMPGTELFDVIGPMAKTVTDLAITLDVLVGFDQADPATGEAQGQNPPKSYADLLVGATLKGHRIAYIPAFLETVGVDAAAVFRQSLDQLSAAGAVLVPLEFTAQDPIFTMIDNLQGLSSNGSVRDHWADYLRGVNGTDISTFADLVNAGSGRLFSGLDPVDRLLNSAGMIIKLNAPMPTDPAGILVKQTELRNYVDEFMSDADVEAILMPSFGKAYRLLADGVEGPNLGGKTPPFPLDPMAIGLSSAAGLPTLSVPAGLAQGVPVGMQLVGRPFSEATLLPLGYAMEQSLERRQAPTFPAIK